MEFAKDRNSALGAGQAFIDALSNDGESNRVDFSGWFSATFTVLAVINPVVTAAMLMQVTDSQSSAQRLRTASSACSIILLILVLAAIGGQYLLHAFGITMDVFRMIGGVIVAYLGFLMLSGRMAQHQASCADGAHGIGSVIQFAASPGTIAAVITLASVHDGPLGLPVTALIAVVLAVAWTWLITVIMMLFVSHINNKVQHISNQFMGLIITTMGLQFFLEGLKHFMST